MPVMKTMDGNKAAAHIAYAFTEVAAIYPITPSSPMAEDIDEWRAEGRMNVFGRPVNIMEMQSEAGAAGAVHGSLSSGALTTTFTASQGLLLMIPNMYKIAGELLPGVIHVSARSLATHALNIFGDHSDVMACSQTGFALLSTGSVQEVMDLAGVAHLTAIKTRVPFLHFFDGFRTSHEQQKIEVIDYADLASLVDQKAVAAFRARGLNPEHPVIRGTNQNPDVFFQAREACQPFFDNVPDEVEKYMAEIKRITGREYHLFNYYGDPEAEEVVVTMGSVGETAQTAVDKLNAEGRKTGVIRVHLYRPFSVEHLLRAMPATVKRIAVLDRVKTPGAPGEPLYNDIRAAYYGRENAPLIIGGRFGLGSKDTIPADIIAVFDNLAAEEPVNNFTIAINDDVNGRSLPRKEVVDLLPEGTIQCKFWGLGSDGTVGANKQAVDIIGSNTDLYTQAYFSYDSKKSGGMTVSHLRFGKNRIRAPYLINQADFVSCSNQAYVDLYDLLDGIKDGGTFLLNTTWSRAQLKQKLPPEMRRKLVTKAIKFYVIDAVTIANQLGLGNRTNMIMQAAFFKLSHVIPEDLAISELNASIERSYGKKGEEIVRKNKAAVMAGINELREVDVPTDWALLLEDTSVHNEVVDPFITDVFKPMLAAQGDTLPVSAFKGREDGSFPSGGTKREKRGVSAFVPEWYPEYCIQCNQCSLVCPHACIRPALLTEEEWEKAPNRFDTLPAKYRELTGYRFRVQVSPLDCLGCGSCVQICPAKKKALSMQPLPTQHSQAENWDYLVNLPERGYLVDPYTVKNSQFRKPLLEFSGACAGCGETPYAKLVTQLFGERLVVANATGCSSIWGAAAPAMPYTTNEKGRGPAWSNSLFEDCAEFGLGLLLGGNEQRMHLKAKVEALLDAPQGLPVDAVWLLRQWMEVYNSGDLSIEVADRLIPLLDKAADPRLQALREYKDYFARKSYWAFGGDGWAYDIGYGGVDHVLSSGNDINLLVFDTEVYSNTGGQSSKATPAAAIAKFAATGKRIRKKDLGMMAMSYGYVYVAQVAMGADMNQTLKAIHEAETYPGPSLIIAYSTCINHGLRDGMSNSMTQMKNAVKCGYWHLYRFDPRRKLKNENPFQLDSREPDYSKFRDFLMSEVRYSSLAKQYPDEAEALFEKTEQDAKDRYQSYLEKAHAKEHIE